MANCCRVPAGHVDVFGTRSSMAAIARDVDMGKMPISGGGNFELPKPGMDPPTRPPTGKGASPLRIIPGHLPWVVSRNISTPGLVHLLN